MRCAMGKYAWEDNLKLLKAKQDRQYPEMAKYEERGRKKK